MGRAAEAGNSSGLVIDSISGKGLLAQWNLDHPSAVINAGDRIIAVNGQFLRGRDMLDKVRTEDYLCLIILQYPCDSRTYS